MGWHQLNDTACCTHQWAQQAQKFTTVMMGCLHPALVYRYYFVWRRQQKRVNANHEWIASRQQGKCQPWVNCFMSHRPAMNLGPLNLRDIYTIPTAVSSMLTTQPWPIYQHGLAPTEWHSMLHTSMSSTGTKVHCDDGMLTPSIGV